MAATGHALLSPSASHRWLHCTPSARAEEKVADKGSEFAEEGTCAHALCENKLRELLGEPQQVNEFEALKDKWYDKAMEQYTDEYVSIVWNKYQEALHECPSAKLYIEKGLDFTPWIPQSFGTSDATIVTDGAMEVIDFKYGRGVEVSAEENPQMMIYALGAVADYELEYNVETVRMTIVQPRISNYSEWEIPLSELKQWAHDTLTPNAKLAYNGEGEHHAGEWCKFCKIKAICLTLANDSISVYTQHSDKELISGEDMGAILSLIPAIKSWCSAVEDYALAKALSGTTWKGYKVVEGRSVRKLTDAETFTKRLFDAGLLNADLYKPAELKPLGELERILGKPAFRQYSEGCVEKPKGKPTLAPDTDKRQEANYNSAVEDFKNLNFD